MMRVPNAIALRLVQPWRDNRLIKSPVIEFGDRSSTLLP
jgi:hypothetical protein